jgi:hypothetical protein
MLYLSFTRESAAAAFWVHSAIWKQGVDWSVPQDQFGNFYSTRGPLSHPRRLHVGSESAAALAHQKSFCRRSNAGVRIKLKESYFLFFVRRAPLINPVLYNGDKKNRHDNHGLNNDE